MSFPKMVKGTRFAITVEKDGVFLYGNRQTFQTLARWMSAIARSKQSASEHWEVHTIWDVNQGPHDSGRVAVLFDEKTGRVFKKPFLPRGRKSGDSGFELTFMAVEPKDLKKLWRLRARGHVPKGWRSLDPRRIPKQWRALEDTKRKGKR